MSLSMSDPTPASGKDELIKKLHKLFNLYGGKILLIHEVYGNDDIKDAAFDELENAYVRRLANLIAQQNQQAVQKARLEEAKHFEHNISQFYDVNGNALDEIKQFARFRVEDLQRLAAAQPHKNDRSEQ